MLEIFVCIFILLFFFTDFDSQVPGIRSLNLNGDTNGYTDRIQEDARTALETVISKSKNETEVIAVLNKWLDLACTNEDIGEAVAKSVCELMPHAEYGDKIRETVLGKIFKLFQGKFFIIIIQRCMLCPYFPQVYKK